MEKERKSKSVSNWFWGICGTVSFIILFLSGPIPICTATLAFLMQNRGFSYGQIALSVFAWVGFWLILGTVSTCRLPDGCWWDHYEPTNEWI